MWFVPLILQLTLHPGFIQSIKFYLAASIILYIFVKQIPNGLNLKMQDSLTDMSPTASY